MEDWEIKEFQMRMQLDRFEHRLKCFLGIVALISVLAIGLSVLGGVILAASRLPETYTVKVPWLDVTFTNVVTYPTNCSPDCRLVRYVKGGETNVFHAFLVPIVVITNR